MADPDLQFLGEQIRRMQADLRNVRSEQIRLESELARLFEEQAQLRQFVENEFAAIQAQFQQVHRTMGANLEVLLTAIRGKAE